MAHRLRPFALPHPDKTHAATKTTWVGVILRGVPAFIMLALLAALFPTSDYFLQRGLRFAPSRCRTVFLMYTRATSLQKLYIRNIIPDDMGIPLVGTCPIGVGLC